MVKDKAQENYHQNQGQIVQDKMDALTNHDYLSINNIYQYDDNPTA